MGGPLVYKYEASDASNAQERDRERERENETVAILAQEPGVHACLSGGGLTPSARGHYQIKQRPFQDRPSRHILATASTSLSDLCEYTVNARDANIVKNGPHR